MRMNRRLLLTPRAGNKRTVRPGKQQRHPNGWRCLDAVGPQDRRGYSLNFSLLTLINFLPPFSETAPVTCPSLGVWQMALWFFP